MYKEYTQLEDMPEMGALNSDSLTRSQKKGALIDINTIIKKTDQKTKREDMHR